MEIIIYDFMSQVYDSAAVLFGRRALGLLEEEARPREIHSM